MNTCNQYLIGLDIGTSSVKGVLVAADGSRQYTGRSGFVYTCGDDGSVEISAQRYLDACFDLFHKLMEQLPQGAELVGLSAASASGNLLLLDENGLPAGPIFNWQDKRVQDEVDRVLGSLDTESYYRSTGWGFDGKTMPLAMLCWYRCHYPAVLDSCSKVCMSTEYLYYCLTGQWGIGTSAGTPFYLIDQCTGKYRMDILEKLGIPEEKLPPVKKTGTVLGTVTEEGAARSGLPVGTPIILGTFDHPSAARGVGVREEGQLLLSCGTSWVGFYPIRDREKIADAHMLIDPFLSESGGTWGGMVSLASVSGQIEAYTRRYIADDDHIYDALTSLAAQSASGAGGLRINPLDEPDDTRILQFPKHHIARAIMEGTVALLAQRVEQLAAQGITATEAVMVGGPSERPLWAKLIQEKTGLAVHVMHGAFAGAIGAAMLAGMAAGLYKDEADAYDRLRER